MCEVDRKMRGVALAIGLIGGMILCVILAGGCSLQGGSGRVAGVDLSLSFGENAAVVTTAQDETESGRDITGRDPYPGYSRNAGTVETGRPTRQRDERRVPAAVREDSIGNDSSGRDWDTRF